MNELFYRINDRDKISLSEIDEFFRSIDTDISKSVIPRLMFPPNYSLDVNGIEVYYEYINDSITILQIIKDKIMFRYDKSDPVADTYIKMCLTEMARFIPHEESPLHKRGDYPSIMFHTSKNSPIYANIGDDLKIHKQSSDNETFYATLDHSSKKAVHYALFNTHASGERLPFTHETQDSVEKVSHNDLPKGYATDVAYNHFLQSIHPLSSSNEQYIGGNKMWQRLAHRAFDDGHHVYLWDNENKTLNHLDTKEKVESGLRYYFTTDPKFKSIDRGHIIISKNAVETG